MGSSLHPQTRAALYIIRVDCDVAKGFTQFMIDRPTGTRRTFRFGDRAHDVVYPLDYGHAMDWVNPEDGEGADAFLGRHCWDVGRHCWDQSIAAFSGWYHKGAVVADAWLPDEHKWFIGLSRAEYNAMMRFWDDQDPRLVQELEIMPSAAAAVEHMRQFCAVPPAGA